MKNKLLV